MPSRRASTDIRTALAALCRSLAERSGDARFSVAAGILAGGRPGPRPVDDAAPLALVRSLLKSGLARSTHSACNRAVTLYAAPGAEDAMARRLRRKSGRE
jgi:hypothetical protein